MRAISGAFASKLAAVLTAMLLLGALSPAGGQARVPLPVFGQFIDAAPVSGKVRVTVPRGHPELLSAARQVPVGSVLDATRGSVRLTAADRRGGTYSGQFAKGQFRLLQRRGVTSIKLVGSCGSAAASSAHAGPNARISRRRRHPYVRGTGPPPPGSVRLLVNAPGKFLVIGRNASAAAAGGRAQYRVANTCAGTQIVVKRGHVLAKRTHAPAVKLAAGESQLTYCKDRVYCQYLIASPARGEFTFGLWLHNFHAPSYRVCYQTPELDTECFSEELSAGRVQSSALRCAVSDGPGTYPLRYFVLGRRLGLELAFTATEPRSGPDFCTDP